MIFIVFTVLLWLIALFHIWDHRRFERDLAVLAAAAEIVGDWRAVSLPDGVTSGRAYRRALMVRTRQDLLRYAVPVVIFAVLLLGIKSAVAAAIYLAIIVIKWFFTTTVLETPARHYAVYLQGRQVFAGDLP